MAVSSIVLGRVLIFCSLVSVQVRLFLLRNAVSYFASGWRENLARVWANVDIVLIFAAKCELIGKQAITDPLISDFEFGGRLRNICDLSVHYDLCASAYLKVFTDLNYWLEHCSVH